MGKGSKGTARGKAAKNLEPSLFHYFPGSFLCLFWGANTPHYLPPSFVPSHASLYPPPSPNLSRPSTHPAPSLPPPHIYRLERNMDEFRRSGGNHNGRPRMAPDALLRRDRNRAEL